MNGNLKNKEIMINVLDAMEKIRSSNVLTARRVRQILLKAIYLLYHLHQVCLLEKTTIQLLKAEIMLNQMPKVILLLLIVGVVVLIIHVALVDVVLEMKKRIIKRLKAWRRKNNYLYLRKETELVDYLVNKELNDGNEKTFWFNLFTILKQYLINLEIDLVDIIFLP